jgi:hypothetical protein
MNCLILTLGIIFIVGLMILFYTKRKKEGYKSQDFLWDCCTDCNLDNQEQSHADNINANWEEDIDWTDGDINWWENVG